MSDKAGVHFKDGLVMFPPHTLELMLRREREKEREACAKLADEIGGRDEFNHAWDVMYAIRARES